MKPLSLTSLFKFPVILRRVVGHSMEPTFKEGQLIVGKTKLAPRRGDVVVARIAPRLEVIKRVVDMRYGLVYIDGDNEGHTKKYAIHPADIIAVIK